MSDVRVALHAMFPTTVTDAEVVAAHDAGAAAVGLTFVDERRDPDSATRVYGDPGATPVQFHYTLRPPCQLVFMGGYHRSGTEPFDPPRIAEMFTHVCSALDADLGRSDLGVGSGLVQESELTGPLEFIDWYQYLGPRIVERIGREQVLTAPAFKVTELDRGAILMMLAPSPWSEDYSRTKVANHLGITLRPLTGRNPATGEPIVIKWR